MKCRYLNVAKCDIRFTWRTKQITFTLISGGAQAFPAHCPLRPARGGMPLPQSAAHPPFPPSLLRNRKRSSVAYELRLRAVAEARREAALRLRMVALRVAIGLLALAATLSVTFIGASAKAAFVSSLGGHRPFSIAQFSNE